MSLAVLLCGPGTWQTGVRGHGEHFLTSFTHGDRLFLQVDHTHFRAVQPHLMAAIFLRLLQPDPPCLPSD